MGLLQKKGEVTSLLSTYFTSSRDAGTGPAHPAVVGLTILSYTTTILFLTHGALPATKIGSLSKGWLWQILGGHITYHNVKMAKNTFSYQVLTQ